MILLQKEVNNEYYSEKKRFKILYEYIQENPHPRFKKQNEL